MVESEGHEDGEGVVTDIAPLHLAPIDQMLQEFQGEAQEEDGEGSLDFLTARAGQGEQQDYGSREGHIMGWPVISLDDAGAGRLQGSDDQKCKPDPGSDAEYGSRFQ
jgi:hypothetical protein